MRQALRICWIGGSRYSDPLNPTHEKKWQTLHQRLETMLFVVAFSVDLRPRQFSPHAHFYLLPALPAAILRYIIMFALGPLLLLWLILRHGVNVIVAHDPYFGAIGALVKGIVRLMGRRVVVIVESHADFEEALFMQRDVPLAGLMRRVMGAVARYSLRRADLFRAVSSNTRDQLLQYQPQTPLHQFMTWTDPDAFKQVPRQAVPSQSQAITYAGVIIPRKGIHLLLDAFARIVPDYPEAHLWLVGSPDNADYHAACQAQAAALKLENHVDFVGRVNQDVLADYMARSRALILPSSSEGLPRVIIEGMLVGLPIIATAVSGIPDVLVEGENGYLIPPEDADAIETALRKLYSAPPETVDMMGATARRFAVDFFSTDTYMQGYADLFDHARRLLEGPKR